MKTQFNNLFRLAIYLVFASGLWACVDSDDSQPTTKNPSHYTMADFDKVAKIDIHVHANQGGSAFVEQARQDNFHLLTINVDYPDFPDISIQKKVALQLIKAHPKRVYFAATFSVKDWGTSNWAEHINQQLDQARSQGAVAVKVWKNIGMELRNKQHQLVMINDPSFTPIFAHLAARHIPLIGHQGEPRNCWLPVNQMSVKNDQQYFSEHPQYYMYLHPEMPSYEQQMAARNAMLDNNPKLQFMGAHLASLEWSVDRLATFLNRYPHGVVDMAARMGQLQAQSQQDRNKVRQFLIRYQDRILYGTDLTYAPGADDETFKTEAHKQWVDDWRYLNTDSVMKVSDLDDPVRGLALPRSVIDKIYRSNAQRFFNIN